ncbi:MAG: hypothetical protein ACT4PY_13550 [Armatimonadota bacterium]
MDDQRTILTRRITFAEDWLARARQQVEDGEQARGVLTLLLAEAEVHRARELGTGRIDAAPLCTRRTLGPAVAVAAVVTIVVAAARWRPFDPAAWAAAAWTTAAAGEVSPHPIVTLSAGHSSLLALVQAPEAIERTVTIHVPVPVTVRVPASPATVQRADDRPASMSTSVRPAAAAQPAPRRSEASAAAAVPPTVSENSTLLSEAELIDLVLATERSLRRATNQ